jgi:hypothetical protein
MVRVSDSQPEGHGFESHQKPYCFQVFLRRLHPTYLLNSQEHHIISLHSGAQYRLLSTCVGSFTCPGIDAQVQGTTVFNLIRQTLFCINNLFKLFVCALAGILGMCLGKLLVHHVLKLTHMETSKHFLPIMETIFILTSTHTVGINQDQVVFFHLVRLKHRI